ncbi:hypothetical protein TSAR_012367, partial [Trichomalopsis sarcophagae]
ESSASAAPVIDRRFAINWAWIFLNKRKAALLTDLQAPNNQFSMRTLSRKLRDRFFSDLPTFREKLCSDFGVGRCDRDTSSRQTNLES